MNMCLLEVAMCEKYRSSHFQSEGGVKSLRTWGGGVCKNFRTGGVTFAGWGGGVSTPLHTMAFSNKSQLCNWMQAAGKIFVKT